MKKSARWIPLFLVAATFQPQIGRAQVPDLGGPLFQSSDILNLELKADFQYAKKTAAADGAGMEGVDRSDPKYYTKGTLRDLANPNRTLGANVRARGMSSLWDGESEFPKLKVEIDETEKLDGTLFSGNRKFRINTHVTTEPKEKFTPMGRYQGEEGPFREALAYDFARILNLPTPGYRRARIQYTDEGSKQSFTRNALLLETDAKIAKRTQSKILRPYDFIADENSKIDPVQGAIFFLFHALIGNGDVGLKVHENILRMTPQYRPLFNSSVFEKANGERFPIVYDLDFSTIVRTHEGDQAKYTIPGFGLTDSASSFIALSLVNLRHRFTEAELQKAVAFVKTKKEALLQVTQTAPLDEAGRKSALLQIESFFGALDKVMNMKLVCAEEIRFYTDATLKKQKMSADILSEDGETPGTLRLGTPVRVLKAGKGVLQVEIIDIGGDLASGQSSQGFIKDKACISTQMPDKEIGKVDHRDLAVGF